MSATPPCDIPSAMPRARFFRAGLLVLSLIFAAGTVIYAGAWMTAVRREEVELGFDGAFDDSKRVLVIERVLKSSPAMDTGMLAGNKSSASTAVP